MSEVSEKVLLVDDEPNILRAYKRTLRGHFNVDVAESGAQALEMLAADETFAVIVSDMKMPEMNGVELLSRVKDEYPNTVRLMLTGNADQQTAVAAINSGEVFQFLNKPCPAEEMVPAIQRAIEQHRLLTVEQNLLENTVNGAIMALVDTLSLTSPKIFGYAGTVKKYALLCAEQLQLPSIWKLEAASQLGQIGAVTLLDSTVDKITHGEDLAEDEAVAYARCPDIAAQLIGRIPRLEPVSEIVRYQYRGYDGSGWPQDGPSGQDIPIEARILRTVFDLVAAESSGLSSEEALSRLRSRHRLYDPKVLEVLAAVVGAGKASEIAVINVRQLTPNSTIAADYEAFNGTLLVKKGQVVTDSLAERLINFSTNNMAPEEICVFN